MAAGARSVKPTTTGYGGPAGESGSLDLVEGRHPGEAMTAQAATPEVAVALVLGPPSVLRDLATYVVAASTEAVIDLCDGSPAAAGPVVVLVDPEPDHWMTAARLGARIVLVSGTELSSSELQEVVAAGVDAILHGDASTTEILEAVHTVAAGGTRFSQEHIAMLVNVLRVRLATEDARLTRREIEILDAIGEGYSVKQTALVLGVSVKTVENLQSRMFRKLGARNRAHAIFQAHTRGLLTRAHAVALILFDHAELSVIALV